MPPTVLRPVAEYVRMSTLEQDCSIAIQRAGIRRYAQRHGLEVVATYADPGKSGVEIKHRPGLQKLIRDVLGGHPPFGTILVYDVSRWGRFQDTDESAHYEFLCRSAGIPVHYCAEQFENDGSIGATLLKTVKRTMAGEYSRELSAKVFAGQSRLIELGYRQGGPAGRSEERPPMRS